jgi:hypothetical protein
MAIGRWTRRRAIAVATLIAGTLDILAALILSGQPAVPLLQAIASALIGERAFAGGLAAAAIGLALHYAIALIMVALFVIEFAGTRRIARRPYLWAMLYGLAAWAAMYLVVLPLRWPALYPSFGWAKTSAQIACHVLLVGLPIGWATSRLRR